MHRLFVALPVLLGTRILDPVNVAVALTIYSGGEFVVHAVRSR